MPTTAYIPVLKDGDRVSSACPFCEIFDGKIDVKPQTVLVYEDGDLLPETKWKYMTGNCCHFVKYDPEIRRMIFTKGE